jgi:hypothetical protein
MRSPNSVITSTTDGDAPDSSAPNRPDVAILDRVVVRVRTDRLADLAGDEALEGAGLQPDGFRPEVGEDVGCTREQEVAGEDRDVVVPAGVGAGRAPAQRSLVHHVVVIKRREVGQLDDHRGGHHTGSPHVAELRGQQHEQRPEPLPAGPDEVPGRLGHERVLALDRIVQRRLDGFHPAAQVGFQGRVGRRDPEGSRELAHDPSRLTGRTATPGQPG